MTDPKSPPKDALSKKNSHSGPVDVNNLPQGWIHIPGTYTGPVDPQNLPEGWVHIPGIYTGPERRTKPTPMFSRFLFWGKRRKNLNIITGEKDYYTDRLSKTAWKFFCITFLLSSIDAGFSIYFIRYHNFQEINPALRPLIQSNSWSFLVGKYILTLGGLLFLIVHHHFELFKWAVSFVLLLYTALCCYHVYLLFHH